MSYDTSSEQISLSEKEVTLSKAINEYLERRKDHTETWLLNQFKEYMQKKRPNVHTQEITVKDVEVFLDSLSPSDVTKTNYESRMKRFLKYIGVVPEVKVKKNRNSEDNARSIILGLQKKLAKTEKERDEEKHAKEEHRKTIEEITTKNEATIKRLTVGKEKECSQCSKLVDRDNVIELNRATFDEKSEEDRVTIFQLESKINMLISNSGKIEEIAQLEAKKTELSNEIEQMKTQKTMALEENKKIIQNQQIVKTWCTLKNPMKHVLVTFGNDCIHCSDFDECPQYGELTNPEDKSAEKAFRG